VPCVSVYRSRHVLRPFSPRARVVPLSALFSHKNDRCFEHCKKKKRTPTFCANNHLTFFVNVCNVRLRDKIKLYIRFSRQEAREITRTHAMLFVWGKKKTWDTEKITKHTMTHVGFTATFRQHGVCVALFLIVSHLLPSISFGASPILRPADGCSDARSNVTACTEL
jgi:hypothetical protein